MNPFPFPTASVTPSSGRNRSSSTNGASRRLRGPTTRKRYGDNAPVPARQPAGPASRSNGASGVGRLLPAFPSSMWPPWPVLAAVAGGLHGIGPPSPGKHGGCKPGQHASSQQLRPRSVPDRSSASSGCECLRETTIELTTRPLKTEQQFRDQPTLQAGIALIRVENWSVLQKEGAVRRADAPVGKQRMNTFLPNIGSIPGTSPVRPLRSTRRHRRQSKSRPAAFAGSRR